MFGELALFGQPAPVTVVADLDGSCTVLELDLLYVLALIERSPRLATALYYACALSLWTTLAALQTAPSPKLVDAQADRDGKYGQNIAEDTNLFFCEYA